MYAASFDYFRPRSIAEAQQLLRDHPGAKVLAGGHSLIPLLKLRLLATSALVDIGRLTELKGISSANGTIRIGALTTHTELASSPILRVESPVIPEAAALIGDQQVRNLGTIGGNVAHADPASDLPTVLVALGARFVVAGADSDRTIAAADFFQGMMATALGEGEILRAIEVPSRRRGDGMAYAKFSHPASRFAVVGAAAVVHVRDDVCTTASVAVGGLEPAAARAQTVEAALVGAKPSAAVIARAAEAWSRSVPEDVLEDIFASADYRRAMAVVYVRRALAAAFERAAA
jgi:carbon-monoxide dehydrogenase medium subunit